MKNWPRVEEGKMVKVGVSPPADERSKSIRKIIIDPMQL